MKPKALIGALAGAITGAALWFWLARRGTLIETSWIPLLIGTLAGTGARLLSEPMRHAWQRGGVVAAIALATTYFTQQSTSYVLEHEFQAMSFNISDLFFPRGPYQEVPQPNRRPTARTPVVRVPPADRRPGPAADAEVVAEQGQDESPLAPERPTINDNPPPAASASDDQTDSGTHPDAEAPLPGLRRAEDGADLNEAVQPPEQVAQPTDRPTHDPAQDGPAVLLALSYALGTLAAYILGRGPEIRANRAEPVAKT